MTKVQYKLYLNWFLDTAVNHDTVSVLQSAVNVDIFALYMFSGNSRFLNICENMYTVKITFMITLLAIYS